MVESVDEILFPVPNAIKYNQNYIKKNSSTSGQSLNVDRYFGEQMKETTLNNMKHSSEYVSISVK